MKKSLANQIARLWNEKLAGGYEPTRTKEVVMNGSRKGDFSVEILPDKGNDGASFHHQEEMTDVMRAFKVSSYVALRTIDGATVVIGSYSNQEGINQSSNKTKELWKIQHFSQRTV